MPKERVFAYNDVNLAKQKDDMAKTKEADKKAKTAATSSGAGGSSHKAGASSAGSARKKRKLEDVRALIDWAADSCLCGRCSWWFCSSRMRRGSRT